VRQRGSEIWVTFNPDEETDPTYQRFVLNPPPDCISLEVNWQDNPWFPEELRREKDYLYRVDPEAAEHVWAGKPRSNQSAQILRGKYVVESFTVPEGRIEREREGWSGPYFGADWGFANDPTTLVKCWIKGQVYGQTQGKLLIEHEAYKVGCEITSTPALFDAVPGSRDHLVRADNARPETISHVRNCGFNIEPCEKWKGSVEDGIAVLRSFEQIIIHPRCVHAQEEARLWSYKRDRLTGDVLPDLQDGNDHTMDAVRYALGPMVQRSRLAVFGDAAEGIAFTDSDLEQRPYLFDNPLPRFISIEASTARVVVFLDVIDDGKTCWILREFYHDSSQEGRQSDVPADLLKFIAGSRAKSRPGICLKKSTTGLSEQLFLRGLYVIEQTEDDEAVISGIRAVSSALGQRRLRVHESCTNTLRELKLYRWDAEQQAKGVERPEKKNSFSCDALRRLAVEAFPAWRLSDGGDGSDGRV